LVNKDIGLQDFSTIQLHNQKTPKQILELQIDLQTRKLFGQLVRFHPNYRNFNG